MNPKSTISDAFGDTYSIAHSPGEFGRQCFRVLTSNGDSVGEMTVYPDEDYVATLHLYNLLIYPNYRGRRIGIKLVELLKVFAKESGYKAIRGICKSYDYPLSAKSKLADWYLRQGFTLEPDSDPQEPGYMGTLIFNLE